MARRWHTDGPQIRRCYADGPRMACGWYVLCGGHGDGMGMVRGWHANAMRLLRGWHAESTQMPWNAHITCNARSRAAPSNPPHSIGWNTWNQELVGSRIKTRKSDAKAQRIPFGGRCAPKTALHVLGVPVWRPFRPILRCMLQVVPLSFASKLCVSMYIYIYIYYI